MKLPIEDKVGVLEALRTRVSLTQSVIEHCKAHGESEENLVNNRRVERQLLEVVRFIDEHALSDCATSFAVGDRVAWMGGIDFGAREVEWIGHVVKVGLGVPYGEYRGTIGVDAKWVELGRHAAAIVEADLPQHGKVERLVHESDCIVEVTKLRRIE